MTFRSTVFTFLVVSLTCLTSLGQESDPMHAFKIGPRYTSDGKVYRPEGWRKWVFIGAPVTPNDMNDGAASFQEFHVTYMEPEAFATFERTGKFPNGTQIVKEMVLVGAKEASSGNGYFMGDYYGLELTVKDTVRFKDEPGGWAYFSFGHKKPPYEMTSTAEDAASCNACHEANADTDFVFTQFYPVLRAAMESQKEGTSKAADKADSDDQAAMDAAMDAVMDHIGADAAPTADDYALRLFSWLQEKPYTEWAAEREVHRSKSFSAHGNVRTYYNDVLEKSFVDGNASHPLKSIAIKELFDKTDASKLAGWAVAYKAREDDGKGNGWYWYEVTSTTDGSQPVAASFGNSKCIGCHKPGVDFIRTKSLDK